MLLLLLYEGVERHSQLLPCYFLIHLGTLVHEDTPLALAARSTLYAAAFSVAYWIKGGSGPGTSSGSGSGSGLPYFMLSEMATTYLLPALLTQVGHVVLSESTWDTDPHGASYSQQQAAPTADRGPGSGRPPWRQHAPVVPPTRRPGRATAAAPMVSEQPGRPVSEPPPDPQRMPGRAAVPGSSPASSPRPTCCGGGPGAAAAAASPLSLHLRRLLLAPCARLGGFVWHTLDQVFDPSYSESGGEMSRMPSLSLDRASSGGMGRRLDAASSSAGGGIMGGRGAQGGSGELGGPASG